MQNAETILTLPEQLDAAAAPALRRMFHKAWRETEGPMVLDMTSVSFIDSAGVGAVVSLMKQLQRHGRTLRISGASGQSRRMLGLVGLPT